MYSWVAIAIVVVAVLWLGWSWQASRERMKDGDVATIIDHYLHGGGKYSEWGDFVETRFRNSRLEHLRRICWEAESKAPNERTAHLEELLERLRSGQFT
jgi:hypothetical protein